MMTETATASPSVKFEIPNAKLIARDLCFYYGTTQALNNINMCIVDRKVTALIGPSGCGKSTLLRTFNRMFELYPMQSVTGEILLNGQNVLARHHDVSKLRSKVGMVFQRPTPFPMSIFENVAFGIKLYESLSAGELEARVQWALQKADLWKEVKDKLKKTGASLSGGQQQRLCIARAIAVKPEVLLLDEPTSALDPISSANIEDLINELKNDYCVAIVTHNMHQASRVSDYTAFMYMGKLIEFGQTTGIFTKPKNKMTEEYITGRFG